MDDQGPEEGGAEGEDADSVSGVGPLLLYFLGTLALERVGINGQGEGKVR
jgi:hypothetical protein